MYVKVKVEDDFAADKIGPYEVYQPVYAELLNHGFIGLMDFMGDDEAIVQAARVSYGRGTTKKRGSRALIRYLKRHAHSSPLEMVVTKWHVKLPIFVARQWMRHRAGTFNEYSGRYSKLDEELYIPAFQDCHSQSVTNKQGRTDSGITEEEYEMIVSTMENAFTEAFDAYLYLLGPDGSPRAPEKLQARLDVWKAAALNALAKMRDDAEAKGESFEIDAKMVDAKISEYYRANKIAALDENYPGLARELSRIVVPVAVYTQFYWTVNLHNLMHFMKLRSDDHAQKEIRVYSDAMRVCLKDYFPVSMEAFEEYQMGAVSFSKSEMQVLCHYMADTFAEFGSNIEKSLSLKGMTQREIDEFKANLNKYEQFSDEFTDKLWEK